MKPRQVTGFRDVPCGPAPVGMVGKLLATRASLLVARRLLVARALLLVASY